MTQNNLLEPIRNFLEINNVNDKINKKIKKIIGEIDLILNNDGLNREDLDNNITLLQSEIKLLISYITSIKGLTPKIEHDLRNKTYLLSSLDVIKLCPIKQINNIKNELNKSFLQFLYFLESLYIHSENNYNLNNFIDKFKTTYKLYDVINLIKDNFEQIQINIDIKNFDYNIIINGLKGDFYIFLENIIKNSIGRGFAKNIKIYTKQKGKNTYLYIADDGTGIDSSKFDNPNEILKLGNSGNGSSGIGLSNLDKRQIDCKVSNQGLKSHFSNLEEIKEKNPKFSGTHNGRGVLFRIKLNTKTD